MNKLKTINDFLSTKTMAMAGVSRNPKKFSRVVFKHLTDNGFTVYPINPNTDQIEETKCYPEIASLPNEVDRLYIVTPKKESQTILEEAIKKGIKKVWIQQMSDTKDVLSLAEENKMDIISKECMFMFADPVSGPHKFHRFIKKLFGRYPK